MPNRVKPEPEANRNLMLKFIKTNSNVQTNSNMKIVREPGRGPCITPNNFEVLSANMSESAISLEGIRRGTPEQILLDNLTVCDRQCNKPIGTEDGQPQVSSQAKDSETR